MSDKIKAAILGSFIGDALSLGVHWEYNPHKISKAHGRIETYLAPEEDSYHSGKSVGDFTHYGDQELVLLESLADRGGFDLEDYFRRWRDLFQDYAGYVDKATQVTLDRIAAGAGPETSGSESTDLSAASRVAPLFLLHGRKDLDELIAAARAMVAMTHNNPQVLDTSEFLARTAHAVLDGTGPVEAMNAAAEAPYQSGMVKGWVDQGLASLNQETMRAVGHFGRACPVEHLFPGVVHILAKHPDDFQTGLVESVMTGGDNAARAMYAGTILGAACGMDGIPEKWITGLSKKERIMAALS